MKYSDEYKVLQEQLHAQNDSYGISGAKYVDYTLKLAESLKTRDILDYGAGKGTLQKGLPFPIQQYDPFVAEFAARPRAARLVVCTDVLEHIEPECLEEVLEDIAMLTTQCVFLQIATGPARKILADGRNAHLIQQGASWWLQKLCPHFDVQHVTTQAGGVIVIAGPLFPDEKA